MSNSEQSLQNEHPNKYYISVTRPSLFPSLISRDGPYWGYSFHVTGLQKSFKSFGGAKETTHIFPSITIEDEVGTTYGGESLIITKPSSGKATLHLKLANQEIAILNQKDALQALNYVHVDNYEFLREILKEHNLFSNSLVHLKEHNVTARNLYLQIKKLHDHASSLKDLDPLRSKIALTLANDLENKTDDFFSVNLNKKPSEEESLAFVNDIKQLIYKQDPILSKHRAIWKPICANILLALTGIGLIFMAVKAWGQINSTHNTQKLSFNGTFFFGHTRLEKEAEKVNQYALAIQ